MRRYCLIAGFILIVGVIFVGCTKDIPDRITINDFPIPPSLKVISSSIKDDQEVNPDHAITVTFNNAMDSANIEITGIKGNTILDPTNTSATFKPFDKIPDGIYTIKVTGKDEYGQELQSKTITFAVKSGSIVTPSYSSLIAYASNIDGDFEICVIRTDGTGITPLTNNFAQDIQPAWSPDGRFIAFSSDRDGLFMWNSDIFIMRADGSAQTNLTGTSGINEFSPCWSYDGKKILYQTDLNGYNEYYVMNADGTNPRPMQDAEVFDFVYSWLFGDNILVVDNTIGNYEIYLGPFNGGDMVNLTNNLFNETYPSWSPDGHSIVFVSDRDFNNELYIMDSDGSNQRRLTNNFADDNYPCWSPF